MKADSSNQFFSTLLAVAPYLLFGIAFAVFAATVLVDISFYSRYTTSSWPERDYLIGWGMAVLLGVGILVLPVRDRWLLFIFWCCKVFICLVAMLFYESHYYDIDAYSYIQFDPTDIYFLQGQTGTVVVGMITRYLMILTGGSYHASKLIFSFAGMFGIYFIWRAAEIYLGRRDVIFYGLCVFYPSILFWSSILGKDPLVLLGVGLFCFGMMGLGTYREHRFKYVGILALGVCVLLAVRMWYLATLSPALLVATWQRTNRIVKTCFILVITMVILYLNMVFFAGKDSIISGVENIYEVFGEAGGSTQAGLDISSPGKLLMFLPYGIFSTIYRPLPFDINNAFSLFAAVENVILLGVTFLALRKFRWRMLQDPLVAGVLTYIVLWSLIYAVPGSRNLGTAVRYKLAFLPVFLMFLYGLIRGRGVRGSSVLKL